MSKIDDGGPAFPLVIVDTKPGNVLNYSLVPGMSLRDWFAGQALVAVMTWPSGPGPKDAIARDRAARSYEYADAMLAERAKRND